MLTGADADLPPQAAALARYAVLLTEEPWRLTRAAVDDLTRLDFGAEAIEAAAGVVATFNYLTRVADASGIEFDYATGLPAFEPDRGRPVPPRPPVATWPIAPDGMRTFSRSAALREAWRNWRAYVFESDGALSYRDRQVLARVAAGESCDAWRFEALHEYGPVGRAETVLAEFAGKLSRQPWQMRPTDLDALRALGYPEVAVLHAISVVALQNADSRLALARRVGPA